MNFPHRRRSSPSWIFHAAILLLAITAITKNPSIVYAQTIAESSDSFCGTNWFDASNSCLMHCPTGTNSECSNALGEKYSCHVYTGCREKIDSGEMEDPDAQEGDDVEEIESTSNIGGSNNFCGTSWVKAMLSCGIQCPLGTECTNPGEKCFAATNCDKPLEKMQADMLVTLLGAETTMEDADGDIFVDTIYEILSSVDEVGVALDRVNLGEQGIVGRRELKHRYKRRGLLGWQEDDGNNMKMKISNITQRILPTGSSALDVSMVITGDYRPPPYLDLNGIVEDSINRQGAKVVTTLRDRGARAGREFFERVDGIEAVARTEATRRPTRSPVRYPTLTPTIPPSMYPSFPPSAFPTLFPTPAPSRAYDQIIMTGSTEELQIGGTTTSSYGYIFNMRTREDSGVIIVNGFDFYTESTDDEKFELWTRMGSFKDHKGSYDGWDIIATGSVEGRGIGRYTAIPPELFTPVSIPGGGGEGGTRAFYLTLEAKQLVYKIGEGSTSDSAIQYSTDEIEIWEGESVLSYPFPSVEEAFYYRFPRAFLGSIQYDRLPCRPFSLYGPVFDLPCPLVPTGSPTIPPPTKTPVTSPPSDSPTKAPISTPTVAPTISRAPVGVPTIEPTKPMPTQAPTSAEPTSSPIVPMRANIILVFSNVPEREMTEREIGIFLEVVTEFLTRHTQSTMVIDGIDLWHHKLTLADAVTGESSSTQVSEKKRKSNVKAKKESIPQVTAVEITLILRISIALLPEKLLGNLAAVEIDENQSELLSLLNEQSAFYTYFKEMDGVESRAIEYVTDAPTLRPTDQNPEEVSITTDDTDSEESVGIMLFVGLGVGFLWCFLTIVSVFYLMRRRVQMQEDNDMGDLLRQEKINPMGTDGDRNGDNESKNKSGSTGGDEEDPSDSAIEEVEGNKKMKAVVEGSSSHSMTIQSLKGSGTPRGIKLESSMNRNCSSQVEGEKRKSSAVSSIKSNTKESISSSLDSSTRSASRMSKTPLKSSSNQALDSIGSFLEGGANGGLTQSKSKATKSTVSISSASRGSNSSSLKGGGAGSQTSRHQRQVSATKSMEAPSMASRSSRGSGRGQARKPPSHHQSPNMAKSMEASSVASNRSSRRGQARRPPSR